MDNDKDKDREHGHGHAADLMWPTAVGNLHMETALKFVNCIAKNIPRSIGGGGEASTAKVSAEKTNEHSV